MQFCKVYSSLENKNLTNHRIYIPTCKNIIYISLKELKSKQFFFIIFHE